MPKKKPATGTDADLNLATMAEIFADEDKARDFLESKRWPNGQATCPHCQHDKAYKLTPKSETVGKDKRKARKGVWKCSKCRKQFTVRVGTISKTARSRFANGFWQFT